MTVLKLVPKRPADTLAVAEALHCGAQDGAITDMAVVYRTEDGTEHLAFTGLYAVSPAAGVNAAMKVSWKLTQIQDGTFGP